MLGMGNTDDDQRPTQPAHRPSRRTEIIDAAIGQFAKHGFADAAIGDIAAEADVAATAVYYHFSGKDELYGAAVRRVFEIISEVVTAARGDEVPAEEQSLGLVIDAVWDWIDEHPDEATLLYAQLPGATPQVTMLRQGFEEQHVQQAFRYFSGPVSGRSSKAGQGVQTLMARTLVDLLISVHTMRLADGPIADEPGERLRQAVHRLAARLVSV